MTASHDLERRIAELYALEAPVRAPEGLLERALERTDTTTQRHPLTQVPQRYPRSKFYAAAAVAALVVVAVLVLRSGVTMRQDVMAPAPSPLTWTPDRLTQDWPVAVGQEPARGTAVTTLALAADAQWDADAGRWEPFGFVDPVGDVPAGAGEWIDIAEVHLGLQPRARFGLVLADDIPRSVPDPADTWIAYGVVLDTNGDGAPDVRIGIDNMPTYGHRAWRTDLASGVTQAKAGPPYGAVGEDRGGTGPGHVGLDTYFPGDDWVGPGHASLRYSPQPGEENSRFYAWASVIEQGRVIATDYAPDTGWLEEGPQPGLSLVGPTWSVEAEFPADASNDPGSGGISIVASLEFTPDGRVVFDSGCSTGTGTVTAEPGAIRISDLRLSEPSCRRADTTAFDASIRTFLAAGDLTYTIEEGVLELHAGKDVLRLQGSSDGPPN